MNDSSTLTLANPETATCPYHYFQTMRREDPVHFDSGVGAYVVSRYEDVVTVLRDPALFSFGLAFGAQGESALTAEFNAVMEREGFGPFQETVNSDPPYHTRIRSLTEKAFRAERVAALEPDISGIAQELFATFIDRGEADAIEDVAIPMTVFVIADQLGISRDRRYDFIRWTAAVLDPLGRKALSRERLLQCAKEQAEMQHYMKTVIEERRQRPTDDMTSNLVHAELNGFDPPHLTFLELLSILRALIVAGNDTTNSAIGEMFLMLAKRPDLLHNLRTAEDRDRALNRFIEELLRREAPVTSLPRVATADTVLGGTAIPKGALLAIAYYSANLDDAQFENACTFDPSRKNLGQHVAFGQGIHRCAGAALARGELKAVLREIIDQFEELSLAVDEETLKRGPSILTRRLVSLPIKFKARRKEA